MSWPRRPLWRTWPAYRALPLLTAGLLLGCAAMTGPHAPSTPSEAATSAATSPLDGGQPSVAASTTASATPTSRCAAAVADLTSTERAGQLIMAGVSSASPSPATQRLLRATRVGSVVLLGNSRAGRRRTARVTADLRAGAHQVATADLLVAVDQEGGLVQRLQGPGFTRIPSARKQATWSIASLRRRAGKWGRQLRAAGVDVDLAPVADVVPRGQQSVNEPIGKLRRGYGSDPIAVGRRVGAVVAGLQGAEVSATLKHFPGLGAVVGNTDLVTRVLDTTTTRDDPALRSFRAGVRAGADLVMVSSATYTQIDPRRRAAYSKTIVTAMLRGDLSFAGVVISDDLTAPGVRESSAARRAVRFLRAGGDLVIISDPNELRNVVRAIRARLRTDPSFAAEVDRKVARILELKAARGRARC